MNEYFFEDERGIQVITEDTGEFFSCGMSFSNGNSFHYMSKSLKGISRALRKDEGWNPLKLPKRIVWKLKKQDNTAN